MHIDRLKGFMMGVYFAISNFDDEKLDAPRRELGVEFSAIERRLNALYGGDWFDALIKKHGSDQAAALVEFVIHASTPEGGDSNQPNPPQQP